VPTRAVTNAGRRLLAALRADAAATGDGGWAWNLAIFRLVFLGAVALPFAAGAVRWTARVMPGLPREAWAPVSFFAWLPPEVLTDTRLAWWVAVANLALIGLGLLGAFTRWTLGAAALLSLYAFGLMQNLGKVDHCHHLVWFLALLAVGPSARFLSVDAALAPLRRRGRAEPGAALATLRCVWILLGLIYLVPGAAKLARAATDGWAGAESLRRILWSQWLTRALYEPGYTPPRWLDGLPSWLLTAGGLAVAGFEAGFLWLVLFRRARPLLAVAGVLFHLLTGLTLGIWFKFLVPAYVALIDWSALGRALGARLGGLPGGGPRLAGRAGGGAPHDRWRSGATDTRSSTGGGTGDGPDDRRGAATARRAAPEGGRAKAAVLAVGAILIAGQASVSVLRVAAPAWPVPVWPFDSYPRFTSKRAAEIVVWEPRAVLEDGREIRLSPAAYARALGSPARCRRNTESILREPDPARRRARSHDLVALLWRHEAPALRAAARAIAVYEARYALGAPARPIDETLLDRFPARGFTARRRALQNVTVVPSNLVRV
jgi:hypothetical protein